MENARIGIIEDSNPDFDAAKEHLEASGHLVVARACNDIEARDLIDEIHRNPDLLNVLLVDGNLRRGEDSGRSAREVLDRVDELGLSTFLIAHSSGSFQAYGLDDRVHGHVNKGRMTYFQQLSKSISDL